MRNESSQRSQMKITIGIPTNRQFKPQTVSSLVQMVAYSKHDYSFVIPTKGYNTAENRNYIVAQAFKNNSDYLLLSDDDMLYPPDSLEKLLAHKKDIVGATYSVKQLPPSLVIGYGEQVKSDEEAQKQTKPFKCEALGGGLLLIKLEVFKKIKPPFFGYEWYDNGMVKMSNDWWFCKKAREAGIDIWCDPTIQCGHIGDYIF